MRHFHRFFLGLIATTIVLIAALCAGVHSPLRIAGGAVFAIEAVFALVVCGSALIVARRLAGYQRALQTAFIVGSVSGGFQVVHLSLEVFGRHFGERPGITLAFMAVSFALWGAAAVRVSLSNARLSEAVFAAIFSGLATMIIAVAYGIALAALGYPDAAYVGTWPEFVRSGWTDARSFAVANSFEAAGSHCAVAPVIGATVGGIGVAASLPFRRRLSAAADGRD